MRSMERRSAILARAVYHHLPALRLHGDRDDADRHLPVLLRLQGLQQGTATKAGRLLRVLLIRDSAVPVYPGGWRAGRLLHVVLTSQDISKALAKTAELRIMRHETFTNGRSGV